MSHAARERLARAGADLRDRLARAAALGAAGAQRLGRALWPPRGRHAAALLAVGVVAAGLHGMAFSSTLAERLPTALDWRAVTALLGRDARPGDAVALSPWWAERAREALPASLPVLAYPRFAGEDLVGVRRVWLVALPEAPGHRSDAEADLLARAAGLDGPQRVGALEVTRLDLSAPLVPLAFLPDRLASASVAAGASACVADARGGWRCAGPGRPAAAREVREVDLLPRACVRVQPSGDPGAPLVVTFRAVRLGRSLRGHAGVIGEAALGGDGPLRLAVAIGGRTVAGVELAPGDVAWRPFAADTAAEAGREADVTFTVGGVAGEARPLCFDAYTLP